MRGPAAVCAVAGVVFRHHNIASTRLQRQRYAEVSWPAEATYLAGIKPRGEMACNIITRRGKRGVPCMYGGCVVARNKAFRRCYNLPLSSKMFGMASTALQCAGAGRRHCWRAGSGSGGHVARMHWRARRGSYSL